ncbi:muscarinic acetylcholine receptor M5-like [Acanthaster planci]|uniref:Muscarinic acetylcholine receptor M5-like n=1 Tax=Acanthaster planci TaxID=133434 RepID=A0A8B8A7K2_ACAPL|nr:muscarinic acetylcholine receptor M5-like [Acanthaster planci]
MLPVAPNDTLAGVCSEDTPMHCIGWTVSISLILGIIGVVTVVGNILVIAAYCRDIRIRSCVSNMFILNLSISDLIVGAVSLPMNSVALVLGRWPFGKIPCQLWIALDYSAVNVGVNMIIFIRLDRYWLVTKKLSYNTFQTRKRAATMITIAWISNVLFFTLVTFTWGPLVGVYRIDYDHECDIESVDSVLFSVFEILAEFVIPVSLILYLNAAVYINIKRRSLGLCQKANMPAEFPKPAEGASGDNCAGNERRIELTAKRQQHDMAQSLPPVMSASEGITETPERGACVSVGFDEQSRDTDSQIETAIVDRKADETESNAQPSKPENRLQPSGQHRTSQLREFRRHRKAAITLSVLVGVAISVWLPFYVTSLISSVCHDCVSNVVWNVVIYLLWCNSTLNPFIYALLVVRFRENIIHFLCLRACRNRNGRK